MLICIMKVVREGHTQAGQTPAPMSADTNSDHFLCLSVHRKEKSYDTRTDTETD